ncbi:MAG TPA: ABC transporter permease, partial [Pyrinomonadaceae bacterium]|nr:ABC transporter permease [Pyrinomonadaceae bacterium]
METLWKDFRYSLRMFRGKPTFTAIVTLSLALGIGATSAIFSVINAVTLRPLPYREPERLAMVQWQNLKSGVRNDRVSPDVFHAWKKNNHVFEEMSTFAVWNPQTLSGDGAPEQVDVQLVSANFFPMLGGRPTLGRFFSEKEDMPQATGKTDSPHGERVVILSYGLWQRRFGGDPGILEKIIRLDGVSHTVIGVMRPGFRFNELSADVWVPFGLDPAKSYTEAGFGFFCWTLARLKAGVTPEQAREDLKPTTGELQQRFPVVISDYAPYVAPLYKQAIGDISRTLWTLQGAVLFVLLIACANVANIRLAQAASREKEIAVRASLGASRARLIRLLLTENLVLSALGGALGLLLAFLLVKLLVALGPTNIPRLAELDALPLDSRVLGFTLGVSMLAGIISGLAPAWHASKLDLNEMLKEGGKGAMTGVRASSLRGTFIVAEMALALALLVGAGLMIRSFLRLQATDPGFNPQNLLTMRVLVISDKYFHRTEAQISTHSFGSEIADFLGRAIKQVETIPGVQQASATSILPLNRGAGMGNPIMPVLFDSNPDVDIASRPRVDFRMVNANFFKTMGIPILKGRDFTEREIVEPDRVIIINETMARRFWPNESPLGRRIKLNRNEPWDEIIGVVGDVKTTDLDGEIQPTVYWPRKCWVYIFSDI